MHEPSSTSSRRHTGRNDKPEGDISGPVGRRQVVMSTPRSRRQIGSLGEASGCCGDGRQEKRSQDVKYGAGEGQEMWGGRGMSVRSDITSGRNRGWEWRPHARDAQDVQTTSDASGRGACAPDSRLIFADLDSDICSPPMVAYTSHIIMQAIPARVIVSKTHTLENLCFCYHSIGLDICSSA